MTRILAFLAILWLGSSSPLAAPPGIEHASPLGEGGPSATTIPRQELYCQLPDPGGTAYSSQIDLVYPFDSGVVDDYVAEPGVIIGGIQWWGQYWNGPGAPSTVDYYVVTFYQDNGNCYPGRMVSTQNVTYFTETYEPANDWYHVSANISPGAQIGGQRYWIEIQACMLFEEEGQWGWQASIEESGDCGGPLQGFPLLGIPYWTEQQAIGVAFCLELWWDGVGVEESSVSAVKSLY